MRVQKCSEVHSKGLRPLQTGKGLDDDEEGKAARQHTCPPRASALASTIVRAACVPDRLYNERALLLYCWESLTRLGKCLRESLASGQLRSKRPTVM